MATDYKTLYQGLLTSTSVTTTYTVPPGLSAIVGTLTFVNVSSVTTSTIKVWQVPTAATSEGDAYMLFNTVTLLPGEKYVLNGPKTLAAETTFKVQASVANVLNCLVEGAEVGGTTEAWGNAGARVTNSAVQSVPGGGAATLLTFDTETFDIDGMHSTSVNTGRLTCVTPGTYVVQGQAQFQSTSATGYTGVGIYKNGAQYAITIADDGENAIEWPQRQVVAIVQMNAGDYVELHAVQDMGGSVNVGNHHLAAVRVGYQTNPGNTLNLATTAVSANYTATILDHTIRVSASGGARTVTLPAVASAPTGFVLVVKKTDSSANTVTLDGSGAETIDGAATQVISVQYDSFTVQNNGTSWDIL